MIEILKENWHAICGPNGMCECGKEKGGCTARLLKYITSSHQAFKAQVLESLQGMEREQLDKDDPDNYEACFAVHGWNDALGKARAAIEAIPTDV